MRAVSRNLMLAISYSVYQAINYVHVDVNLADFQSEAAPPKELSFEVKFAGIDTVLVQDDHDILHSGIQGLINHLQYLYLTK